MTLHAKKAAEDASKHALEASKQAAGVSKNTLEDLTYVGKSTFGDLTKTAKEAAAKKGLMKTDTSQSQQQLQASQQQQQQFQSQSVPGNSLVSHGLIAGTGRDFFSSFSSEINGITSSTSSMFSGLFGKSKKTVRFVMQKNHFFFRNI